jgi:hypothetical protein
MLRCVRGIFAASLIASLLLAASPCFAEEPPPFPARPLPAAPIAGYAAPRAVLIRDDRKASKPWWLPVPAPLGPKAAGLGISGTM